MAAPSPYAATIRGALDRMGLAADPNHVEAWMRLEHPTLDGLCRAAFDDEVALAVACIREAGPDATARLAASFGL